MVYTFFHCLIRDEQEKTRMEEGEESRSHSPMSGSTSDLSLSQGMNEGGAVAGKVKVHLMYDRRRESLSVMIRHVRDLV